jgi:hypothetical protein
MVFGYCFLVVISQILGGQYYFRNWELVFRNRTRI